VRTAMYDGPKIIAGIVVFVGVVTLPFWYTTAAGNPAERPEPVLPVGQQSCVESRQFMRDNHMELLNEWRNAAVRRGKRTYVSTNGARYEVSLTKTCLSCHNDRQAFCQRCHDYAGVHPDCWGCHVDSTARE